MATYRNQFLAPLHEVMLEDIELLYKQTVIAIFTISIAYISGIIFFTVLFLLKSDYCYMALLFPLLGYFWLFSVGAKYVNNHYCLKKTSDGTMVYIKKKQSFSTLVTIHIAIFLISSIHRLIYETNNLILIKKELHRHRIYKSFLPTRNQVDSGKY